MRQMISVVFFAAFLGAVAIAGDLQPPAPSSPQAVEAKKKHDAAIKETTDSFHKAVIEVDKQYVADLDAALTAAMSAHNIDLTLILNGQKTEAQTILKNHEIEFANRVPIIFDLGNGATMQFMPIPAGTFIMGSPPDEVRREASEPQHKVTLTKEFYMGVTQVTQRQWKSLMGKDNNPSQFRGDDLPVEHVSWDDAVAFCNRLSQKEGMRCRLPTEAEWEYACRAGTKTRWYTGNDEKTLDEASWHAANSGGQTHPVGQKKANAWGLYDMHGNVMQWCSDWYGDYPNTDVTDPKGPDGGRGRLLRGGAADSGALDAVRCASRYGPVQPGDHSVLFGLRVVVESK